MANYSYKKFSLWSKA